MLLQAGLTAKVINVSKIDYGADEITTFDLYISEKMILKKKVL